MDYKKQIYLFMFKKPVHFIFTGLKNSSFTIESFSVSLTIEQLINQLETKECVKQLNNKEVKKISWVDICEVCKTIYLFTNSLPEILCLI